MHKVKALWTRLMLAVGIYTPDDPEMAARFRWADARLLRMEVELDEIEAEISALRGGR